MHTKTEAATNLAVAASKSVQDAKRESDRRVRAERSLATTKVENARKVASKQQRKRDEQMVVLGEGLKLAVAEYETTIADLQYKNKEGLNEIDAVSNRLRTAERNAAGRLDKIKVANQAANQLKDAWEEQTDEVSRLQTRLDELQEHNKANEAVITELRAEITVSIHFTVFY